MIFWAFGLNETIFMTTSQENLLLKPHYLLIWLVLSTPLKNISQLGWLFPIYGKIQFMFQTTNQFQFLMIQYDYISTDVAAQITHLQPSHRKAPKRPT